MIDGFFNGTAAIQRQTTAADALKGIVAAYVDLYPDVPVRVEDVTDVQREALAQLDRKSVV